MADTGASVNSLDEVNFGELRTKPKLSRTKEKIFPYGSNKPLATTRGQVQLQSGDRGKVQRGNILYCQRHTWLLSKLADVTKTWPGTSSPIYQTTRTE